MFRTPHILDSMPFTQGLPLEALSSSRRIYMTLMQPDQAWLLEWMPGGVNAEIASDMNDVVNLPLLIEGVGSHRYFFAFNAEAERWELWAYDIRTFPMQEYYVAMATLFVLDDEKLELGDPRMAEMIGQVSEFHSSMPHHQREEMRRHWNEKKEAAEKEERYRNFDRIRTLSRLSIKNPQSPVFRGMRADQMPIFRVGADLTSTTTTTEPRS